jgi:hypothetical protein
MSASSAPSPSASDRRYSSPYNIARAFVLGLGARHRGIVWSCPPRAVVRCVRQCSPALLTFTYYFTETRRNWRNALI